jgi:hypothetical protein
MTFDGADSGGVTLRGTHSADEGGASEASISGGRNERKILALLASLRSIVGSTEALPTWIQS